MKTTTDKKVLMNITAILHDTGKIKTFKKEGNKISFINHEDESLKIADKFLNNLKFSNNDKKYIETLIKYHMIIHEISDSTDEKLQRNHLAKIYIELFEDEELLNDCIEFAKKDSLDDLSKYEKLKKIVEEFSKEPILIKGKDVEEFPEKIRGKLIKRMRLLQLSKQYNKKELLKILKSEANNIIANKENI